MFSNLFPSWFVRSPRRAPRSTARTNRTLLRVTQLETRLTPSAPMIHDFTGRIIANTWVVTGQVTDDNPAQTTVTISGTVAGSATVNPNGFFEFIANHTGGGTVTAEADNPDGSDTGTTSLAPGEGNQAPYVSLKVTYNTRRIVTLSGRVVDETPGNLAITFGGKVSGSATTDANGNFSQILTATGLGAVTAVTRDAQGVDSNIATLMLTSAVPKITNFVVTTEGHGMYTITGKVVDEDPQGMIVTLSSVYAAVNGQTVTAASDGTFSLNIFLPPGAYGSITAKTTDWWGQDSDSVTTLI